MVCHPSTGSENDALAQKVDALTQEIATLQKLFAEKNN